MSPVFENHPSKPYSITTDIAVFDFDRVHSWLFDAYWSKAIPEDVCKTSFENSFSFGLFHNVGDTENEQVGCARFVTDYATFGYLADVYIDSAHRGLGLGDWMIKVLMTQDGVRCLRRCMLATSNMHSLYEKFGFTALSKPEIIMELVRSDIYN